MAQLIRGWVRDPRFVFSQSVSKVVVKLLAHGSIWSLYITDVMSMGEMIGPVIILDAGSSYSKLCKPWFQLLASGDGQETHHALPEKKVEYGLADDYGKWAPGMIAEGARYQLMRQKPLRE